MLRKRCPATFCLILRRHPASPVATSCPGEDVTSCLARRDILPWRGRDILPSRFRDTLPRPLSPPACLLAHQKPQRRHHTMFTKDPQSQKNAQNAAAAAPQSTAKSTRERSSGSRKVTEARASAQRAKLDAQAEERRRSAE